jgi:UDP-N-acetylmuramyl pentapeptide phosphotransferase/UDP-N-acetylglucosamine-1-phosphate transferase
LVVVALVATRWLTGVHGSRGRSQPILQLDAHSIAVPDHQHKVGTATMGGIAILGAAALGYLVSHVRSGIVFSDQTLIALVGVAALASVGLVDDVIKVRAHRNRGLFWKLKGAITLGVSIFVAALFGFIAFTQIAYMGFVIRSCTARS